MLNYDVDLDRLMDECKAIRIPADERKALRERLENPPEGENTLAQLRDYKS